MLAGGQPRGSDSRSFVASLLRMTTTVAATDRATRGRECGSPDAARRPACTATYVPPGIGVTFWIIAMLSSVPREMRTNCAGSSRASRSLSR